MKKIFITVLLLGILNTNQIFAQSDLIHPLVTITHKKDYTVIHLKIDVIEAQLSKSKVENKLMLMDKSKDEDLINIIDIGGLKDQVSLQLQNKVVVYLIRQPYFYEIIKLISSQEDKDKAFKIYDDFYGSNSISIETTRKVSLEQIKSQIDIEFPLVIESDTELVIDSLNVIIDNVIYKTEKVTISI